MPLKEKIIDLLDLLDLLDFCLLENCHPKPSPIKIKMEATTCEQLMQLQSVTQPSRSGLLRLSWAQILIIESIHRRSSKLFTISSPRREPSPTRTFKWPGRNRVQITCNTSSACHVQHVVLRATWYEGTAQVFSLIELKSHFFEFYFIG